MTLTAKQLLARGAKLKGGTVKPRAVRGDRGSGCSVVRIATDIPRFDRVASAFTAEARGFGMLVEKVPAKVKRATRVAAYSVGPAVAAIILFTVSGPPVPKARARTVRRRGRVTTITPAKTAAYERTIAVEALATKMGFAMPWPMDTDYRLSCRFYRAIERGDLDNLIKSVADALNGVLWTDDRAVTSYGEMWMGVDRANPRVEVTVEAFERRT